MSYRSFSVLFAVYKEPTKSLERTIYSIFSGQYFPIEVIIVVDNPDYDHGWIQAFCYNLHYDTVFKIIVNDTNIGLAKSLNIGAALITQKYFARIDVGDICINERFKCQYDYLDNNDVSIIGAQVVDATTGRVSSFPTTRFLSYCSSLVTSAMAHPTFFGRSIIFQTVQYPNYRLAQDFGFVRSIRKAGYQFLSVDSVLVKYHNSANQDGRYKKKQSVSVMLQMFDFNKKSWFYCFDEHFNITNNLVFNALFFMSIMTRGLAIILRLITR